VVLAVSAAEPAKRFDASLGWREDADRIISEDYRVLQFTPARLAGVDHLWHRGDGRGTGVDRPAAAGGG
jgi:hypothetical protein